LAYSHTIDLLKLVGRWDEVRVALHHEEQALVGGCSG
jgi:hypothetical protein